MVSEGKNNSKWPGDHYCDILEGNVASFHSVPKEKKICQRVNGDCVTWFLAVTLMQIYDEKEQLGRENYKLYSVREQRTTRKGSMGANSCAQGDEKFKANPVLSGENIILGGARLWLQRA